MYRKKSLSPNQILPAVNEQSPQVLNIADKSASSSSSSYSYSQNFFKANSSYTLLADEKSTGHRTSPADIKGAQDKSLPLNTSIHDIADVYQFIKHLKAKKIKIKPRLLFEIDEAEHVLYQHIEKLAEPVAASRPFSGLNKSFELIEQALNAINELYDIRHQLPYLYFTKIAHNLIPAEFNKEGDLTLAIIFMQQEFDFFVKHCLNLSKITKKEHANLLTLIRQLISRPIGQTLMIELNQFTKRRQRSISVSAEEAGTTLAVNPMNLNKDDNSYEHAILKLCPEFHKSKTSVPEVFNYGKNQCFALKLPFISLGHEFIHILNFFNGSHKLNKALPAHLSNELISQLFLSQASYEEFSTIVSAKINENSVRSEHGLNFRFSHVGCNQVFVAEDLPQQVRKHLSETLPHAEFEAFYKENDNASAEKIAIVASSHHTSAAFKQGIEYRDTPQLESSAESSCCLPCPIF